MEDRVIKVEQSTKSAHHRLDDINKRVDSHQKRFERNEEAYLPAIKVAHDTSTKLGEFIDQSKIEFDDAKVKRREQHETINEMRNEFATHMKIEERTNKIALWVAGTYASGMMMFGLFLYQQQSITNTSTIKLIENVTALTDNVKDFTDTQRKSNKEFLDYIYQMRKSEK